MPHSRIIFKNWKENKEPLGKALLIEKVAEGLPFIPVFTENGYKNEETEAKTYLYVPEKWKVEWVSLTPLGTTYVHKEKFSYWIRRKKRSGLSSSGRGTLPPIHHYALEENLPDNFLTVDGKEIY